MDKKILVAIPTYAGGAYCRNLFIEHLTKLTTKNLSFLFVTNSGESDKQALERATKELPNCTIIINEEQCEQGHDQVVSNRNKIRDYFLQGDYDYLMFYDHDVIGPLNAIDALLSHNKKVITGWYIMGSQHKGEEKPQPRPMVYTFIDDKKEDVRQLELKHVLSPWVAKIACAGLGCTLIHRSLLEKISFTRLKGTEDAPFYAAVRDAGEDLWLDSTVACWHIKHPPGNKNNQLYDPRNYTLKQ